MTDKPSAEEIGVELGHKDDHFLALAKCFGQEIKGVLQHRRGLFCLCVHICNVLLESFGNFGKTILVGTNGFGAEHMRVCFKCLCGFQDSCGFSAVDRGCFLTSREFFSDAGSFLRQQGRQCILFHPALDGFQALKQRRDLHVQIIGSGKCSGQSANEHAYHAQALIKRCAL